MRRPIPEPTLEVASGVLAAITSGGVITFALFPLALPIVILTVVALAPLALVGILAAPIVLLVRMVRRRRRSRPPRVASGRSDRVQVVRRAWPSAGQAESPSS